MNLHQQLSQLEQVAQSVANGARAGLLSAAEVTRLEDLCALLTEAISQWKLREEERLLTLQRPSSDDFPQQ